MDQACATGLPVPLDGVRVSPTGAGGAALPAPDRWAQVCTVDVGSAVDLEDDSVPAEHFERCERAAVSLAPRPSVEAQQELASLVDHLLWSLFPTRPETAPFWTDGIEVDGLEVLPAGLTLTGALWCADHREQWRVPVRADLRLSGVTRRQLDEVCISLGDGARADLRDQPARAARAQPDAWLCVFRVPRPSEDDTGPQPLVDALRAWATAHPDGKLVDRHWQPLTLEAAEVLVREAARAGAPVTSRATWLDGGDALQVG